MGKYIKYTKELLENAVKHSVSITGVLDKIGLKMSGSSHFHISKKLKEFQIDTSHFLGRGFNRGKCNIGGNKRSWQEILVKRESGRERTSVLRRALIEYGREYSCEEESCPVKNLWNGKEIVLPIHHINGDETDCRPENLKFLCWNCHSQTSSFSKNRVKKKERTCSKCGSKISRYSKSGLCASCSQQKRVRVNNQYDVCSFCGGKKRHSAVMCKKCSDLGRRKVEHPSIEQLRQDASSMSMCAVGRKYGVSDNAVRKWLKNATVSQLAEETD